MTSLQRAKEFAKEMDEKDSYAFLGGFIGFLEKTAANCSRSAHRGKAKSS